MQLIDEAHSSMRCIAGCARGEPIDGLEDGSSMVLRCVFCGQLQQKLACGAHSTGQNQVCVRLRGNTAMFRLNTQNDEK